MKKGKGGSWKKAQCNKDFTWDTVYDTSIPSEELTLVNSAFLLTHSCMGKLKETGIFMFMKLSL